jgi:hypothetical protein
MNVSYAEIKGWYDNQRSHGFHVCQYGNLHEFGWQVKNVWPPGSSKGTNCSTAAKAGNPEQALLCQTQQLLNDKYGDALMRIPNATGASDELLCTVRVFPRKVALEDAIGSHACSVEARAGWCPSTFISGVHSSYRLAL